MSFVDAGEVHARLRYPVQDIVGHIHPREHISLDRNETRILLGIVSGEREPNHHLLLVIADVAQRRRFLCLLLFFPFLQHKRRCSLTNRNIFSGIAALSYLCTFTTFIRLGLQLSSSRPSPLFV